MVSATQASQYESLEASRLGTFLKYDIPSNIAGAIFLLSVAAVFDHIGVLIVGLVVLSNVGLLLWAWGQMKRNKVERAAVSITLGMWIIIAAIAVFISFCYSFCTLLLVLSVMVALPYVSRPTFLRLTVGATLTSIISLPLALLNVSPFPLDMFPNWLFVSSLSIGLPICIGLNFLLTGQYSNRLSQTLAQTQASNEALRASERELEAKVQELQESRSRIVTVQEGVRRDIGAHLHGRVQGILLVLKGRLQELLKDSSHLTEVAQPLGSIIDDMGQVIQEEISSLSRRLYPSILRRGLVPALRSLGNQFQGALAIDLELAEGILQQERGNRNLIPEPVRLAAYRIAEEALTNVVKHAQASRVTLRLELSAKGGLHLMVGDNGQGFEADGTSGGLGMSAIQDYAGAVGGESAVFSVPGRGTDITATLPFAGLGAGHPGRVPP